MESTSQVNLEGSGECVPAICEHDGDRLDATEERGVQPTVSTTTKRESDGGHNQDLTSGLPDQSFPKKKVAFVPGEENSSEIAVRLYMRANSRSKSKNPFSNDRGNQLALQRQQLAMEQEL